MGVFVFLECIFYFVDQKGVLMRLESLLKSNYCVLGGKADDREEIFSKLIHAISPHYHFKVDNDGLRRSIIINDNLPNIVSKNGMIIYHARLDDFNDTVVGIMTISNKLVISDIDIKMAVLIFTSKHASSIYLNTLAAFASLSYNEYGFERLIKEKDPDRFIEYIKEMNISVKKELTVFDIMTKDIISVKDTMTLKELIDVLSLNDISYAPVVDANGKLIGEIGMRDILKKGLPDYVRAMENLNFLKTLEPFEELLKDEGKITVREVMSKPSNCLSPDDSVMESVLEFSQKTRRHLPVVDKSGVLVGIISYMDILFKVLRG